MSSLIEKASRRDLSELQSFLHLHWRANHIFSRDEELFDWQHWNEEEGCYNFLLARGPNGDLMGVLGFIPTFHFDPKLRAEGDYFGAIWRINGENPQSVGVGHHLFRGLLRQPNFKTFGALGISADTINYLRCLKYWVGEMAHYYLPNPTLSHFEIAEMDSGESRGKVAPRDLSNVSLVEVGDLTGLDEFSTSYAPRKTFTYLINRYGRHPRYRYKYYLASGGGKPRSIFVVRKVFVGSSSCLRVVDIYGDLQGLQGLQEKWENILVSEGAEYLDCYNSGIDPALFVAMGWRLKSLESRTVIPNYFEPFEKRNVPVFFGSSSASYVLYRGDSDQDRPNLIKS